MKPLVNLVIPYSVWSQLKSHLFPGDGDEHGAALVVGSASSEREIRLLAKKVVLAKDGADYVPGSRSYRVLNPSFILQCALECRDDGMGLLLLHNHGGTNSVTFSNVDIESHERGYPALLDILRQQIVGGLVFAENAIAGDIWFPNGDRRTVDHATIVGPVTTRLYQSPPPRPPASGTHYDRQARLFGDRGQEIFSKYKVGIIGAGGAGSLVNEFLARLGVGHIVIIDPERLDPSNVSRVVDSSSWDAMTRLRENRFRWLRCIGDHLAAHKVSIASRVARKANSRIRIEPIIGNVVNDDVAMRLVDCDYLFLAADSAQARLVFNAIVHQYLIPGIQIGAKVPVDQETGVVGEPYSVVRPVVPDHGCLSCNGLILPSKITDETLSDEQRKAQRYVEDSEIFAPSVITLNSVAAGHATNEFAFNVTGLAHATRRPGHHNDPYDYIYFEPRGRVIRYESPRKNAACRECGMTSKSRLARGDAVTLPTRIRSQNG